jgi:hypothetical protein
MIHRSQACLWAAAGALWLLLPAGGARAQALCKKTGAAAVADTDSVCGSGRGGVCTPADYAKAAKAAYGKALNQCVGKVKCDSALCLGECVIVVRGANDKEVSTDPTCGTETDERCHVHVGGVCDCVCPHVFVTVSVPGPYLFRGLEGGRPFAGRIERDPVAATVTAIALDLSALELPAVTLFAQDTDEETRHEFVAVGMAQGRLLVWRGREEGPGRVGGRLEIWAEDGCGALTKAGEHHIQGAADPSLDEAPAPAPFQRGIDPLLGLEGRY